MHCVSQLLMSMLSKSLSLSTSLFSSTFSMITSPWNSVVPKLNLWRLMYNVSSSNFKSAPKFYEVHKWGLRGTILYISYAYYYQFLRLQQGCFIWTLQCLKLCNWIHFCVQVGSCYVNWSDTLQIRYPSGHALCFTTFGVHAVKVTLALCFHQIHPSLFSSIVHIEPKSGNKFDRLLNNKHKVL